MRKTMNRSQRSFSVARVLGTTSLSLVGSLAMFCLNSQAQDSGPLDRIAHPVKSQVRLDEVRGRYMGPLDRSSTTSQNEVKSKPVAVGSSSAMPLDNIHSHSVSFLPISAAQAKSLGVKPMAAKPSAFRALDRVEIADRPRLEESNYRNVPARPQYEAIPVADTNTAGGLNSVVGSQLRYMESRVPSESIDRPAFDTVRPIEQGASVITGPVIRPEAFSTTASTIGSSAEFKQDDLKQVQHTHSPENFEGTFEEFQAMNQSGGRRVQVGQPVHGHSDVPDQGGHYQPTQLDYQAHGLAGYGDDTVFTYGYQDGAAFGFDRNRLWHPLESPTTQLMGAPTVEANFGVTCYCNEWANMCCGKNLDYVGNCGGLKANPGHFGLKWLGSNDPCDVTEPCDFFSRLRGCKTNSCSDSSCGCSK